MRLQMDSYERQREAIHARRVKGWDRYSERIAKREAKAEEMIGELCRDGKATYYVFPAGGKYREGSRIELIDFLIRNNYA